MPRINIYPNHHSIETNNLCYSDISTLHSTKLPILKMIFSIFIWICIHSSKIVHVYSTCMEKSLKSSRFFFLHTWLHPMGTIISIWHVMNFHITCDRFPFQIFNNSILLVVILFIRGIVFMWLKIIVLLINFLSITNVTSILNLFFFIHIYSWSSGRSMYTWNERHTRRLILLVLPILCPSLTRSRTWSWWFLKGKNISHSYWLIDSCL